MLDYELLKKKFTEILNSYSKDDLVDWKKTDEQQLKTNKMKLSEYLARLNACKEAIEWVGEKTIEQAVAECHRGDWLLWLASRVRIDRRKLSLAKGLCANTVRHLMQDQMSVSAVDAAIAYGKGEIDEVELENAADDAYAVYSYASYYTASSAASAAYYAASAATSSAHYAAASAASADYYDAASDAAYDARIENQAKTADICREVFGKELINKVN